MLFVEDVNKCTGSSLGARGLQATERKLTRMRGLRTLKTWADVPELNQGKLETLAPLR